MDVLKYKEDRKHLLLMSKSIPRIKDGVIIIKGSWFEIKDAKLDDG